MQSIFQLLLITTIFVGNLESRYKLQSATAPFVWLGEAPFCRGDPSLCAIFDLDYVESSSNGDGQPCWTGVKVKCQARPLNVTLVNSSSEVFTGVTFNIYQRPFVVSHDGQLERTCHIPRALVNRVPELDVVVVEEGFLDGCFGDVSFRALMAFYGFFFSTPTVGKITTALTKPEQLYDRVSLLNGGVFLVSRWPILEYQIYVYTNFTTSTADPLARKGLVYARIEKTDLLGGSMQYHVIGTHLQAQDGVPEDVTRVLQSGEIADFLLTVNPSPMEPVIFLGDFNADNISDPNQVALIQANLRAAIPTKIGDMRASYDPGINDVAEPGLAQWIDYSMYSLVNRLPIRSQFEGLDLRADETIEYCNQAKMCPYFVYSFDFVCSEVHQTHFMSDHFPVVVRYHF